MDPIMPNLGPRCDALDWKVNSKIIIQNSPFCGFWKSLEPPEHSISLFILVMNLPQCLQLILYVCPKLSQSEHKSRRENKSGFPFRLEGFQILLSYPPAWAVVPFSSRKERAGVGSLCLVLEGGWELTEVGALHPAQRLLPSASRRGQCSRTSAGAGPAPAWSRNWALARSAGSLKMD